jgi:hypothetical protein
MPWAHQKTSAEGHPKRHGTPPDRVPTALLYLHQFNVERKNYNYGKNPAFCRRLEAKFSNFFLDGVGVRVGYVARLHHVIYIVEPSRGHDVVVVMTS